MHFVTKYKRMIVCVCKTLHDWLVTRDVMGCAERDPFSHGQDPSEILCAPIAVHQRRLRSLRCRHTYQMMATINIVPMAASKR